MLAKTLSLANAFLGGAEQEGAEASAAPPGCSEILILHLHPAFGAGWREGWWVSGGPCTQRWDLPPARSPGATVERGAVVMLFMQEVLG